MPRFKLFLMVALLLVGSLALVGGSRPALAASTHAVLSHQATHGQALPPQFIAWPEGCDEAQVAFSGGRFGCFGAGTRTLSNVIAIRNHFILAAPVRAGAGPLAQARPLVLDEEDDWLETSPGVGDDVIEPGQEDDFPSPQAGILTVTLHV